MSFPCCVVAFIAFFFSRFDKLVIDTISRAPSSAATTATTAAVVFVDVVVMIVPLSSLPLLLMVATDC